MHSKAIEAAARAVLNEMPIERGFTAGEAAIILTQAAVQAYLAAMEAEGFAMVPVEATPEMVDVGASEMFAAEFRSDSFSSDAKKAYRAMLSARPNVQG